MKQSWIVKKSPLIRIEGSVYRADFWKDLGAFATVQDAFEYLCRIDNINAYLDQADPNRWVFNAAEAVYSIELDYEQEPIGEFNPLIQNDSFLNRWVGAFCDLYVSRPERVKIDQNNIWFVGALR